MTDETAKILVITGPTATGKTAAGVLLAQALGGEVVSADSMQVYRRMDVGTAKATPEEMQGIPHTCSTSRSRRRTTASPAM